MIAAMFSLCWIEIFNPMGFAFVLALLALVRRRWHVLLYIFGSYVAYVTASIAIFIGVDRFIKGFLERLMLGNPTLVGAAQVALGACAAIGCVWMAAYLVKAAREKREMSFEKMLYIKSVRPWFIILLSFGSTWSVMGSAWAVMAYIAILVSYRATLPQASVMLSLYCLAAMLPKLAIYVLSGFFSGPRFIRAMDVLKKVFTGFCMYSIPVVLAVIAWWGLANGIPRLG